MDKPLIYENLISVSVMKREQEGQINYPIPPLALATVPHQQY